jgi:hypothetical protein
MICASWKMAMEMTEHKLQLNISADEYLRYYSGSANTVTAKTLDGISIRFPASALQKFLLRDGIQGVFKIVYDSKNRLLSFDRVSY